MSYKMANPEKQFEIKSALIIFQSATCLTIPLLLTCQKGKHKHFRN